MAQTPLPPYLSVLTKRNSFIFSGALAVLLIASVFLFGWYVLGILAVSVITVFIVEFGFSKIRKKPLDMAWWITPMIFTLMMPSNAPLWMVAIGSWFGVFFGKSVFGGFGKNIFNPSVVGVLFVLISFPREMATPLTDPILALRATAAFPYTLWDLMAGNAPGFLGETFRLGILILGIGLVVLKIVDWRIPLSYLGSVFLITLVGGWIDPNAFKDPVHTLFVGGLMFASFFVATDPVTSPIFPLGKIIYGIGLGFLTVLIRNFAAFPEGVVFSVILMNAVTGLLDNWNSEKSTSKKEASA